MAAPKPGGRPKLRLKTLGGPRPEEQSSNQCPLSRGVFGSIFRSPLGSFIASDLFLHLADRAQAESCEFSYWITDMVSG